MHKYKNPKSGIDAYEFGPDYIITRFKNYYYLYSDRVTGTENIKHMKALATKGEGLSGFISKAIRKNYEAMFESEKELRAYLKKRN